MEPLITLIAILAMYEKYDVQPILETYASRNPSFQEYIDEKKQDFFTKAQLAQLGNIGAAYSVLVDKKIFFYWRF